MKYDIPTLLALSRNARIDAERFSAQAASNNLLRRRKASKSASVLTDRPANRLNEVSSHPLQSEEPRSPPIIHLRRPSRQPHDPPQGVFSQSDVGFARFLKEHSSPKHQRVTAGGRIVPMNPLTPAPKIKLPVSLQGVTTNIGQSEPKSKLSEKSSSQAMDTDSNISNYSNISSLPAGTLPDHTRLSSGNENWGSQFQLPGLFQSIPSGPVTPAMILQPNVFLPTSNQHTMQPEHQSLDYFSCFQNYSAYGLGADQVAWLPNTNQALDSRDATLPFMPGSNQPNSSVSGSSSEFSTGSNLSGFASAFGTLSTGFDPFYQPNGLPGQQITALQPPALNQPLSFPSAPQEEQHWTSLQEATRKYGSLSSQLSRLDRHMAVHTWDMDLRQKRLLVEQRMSLVRELDALRTYKEQLESLYGQANSSTLNIQQPLPADAQTSSVHRTSRNTANKGIPLPPRVAGSTAAQTALTQPVTKPANAFPTVLLNEQPSKSVCQPQSKDNKHSFDVRSKSERKSMNERPLYETKLPCCDSNLKYDRRNTQGRSIDQSDMAGMLNSTDGWTTPTQSAPPEIRRVYRKIEEATRHGASIEGLLQELASVTRRLVKQTNEDSNGSPRPTPRRMSKAGPEDNIRGETGTTRGFPKSIGGCVRSARLSSKRQWASENQPRTSAEFMGSYGTDKDDDSDSWSSYVSTTDSWDTIQEGDQRWIERETAKDGNPRTSRNGKSQDTVGKAEKVARQAQKTRDTLGWIQNTSPDHRMTTQFSGTNSASKAFSHLESIKQNYPPLMTQCFSKDGGLGPHKTAALAVSQNVNAHACLPHFDGAGDIPSPTETSQMSTI